MSRITQDDRSLAEALLDAVEAAIEPAAKAGTRRVAINTIAKAIADIHERAVACAVVRVEREFSVRARKNPGEDQNR